MDLTIKQRIDIRHHCPAFGVLLRWLNPLNSYEAWLFNGRTTRILDVSDAVVFESADARHAEVLKKDGAESITLRTMNFNKKQAKGLSTLFTSPKVVAYIDGLPVPVRVGSGSFTSVDDLVKRQTLEFEIYLPKVNSLMQ